jgi:hypothetical protein
MATKGMGRPSVLCNYSATWAEEDWADYILNSGECNETWNYLLFHDNLDSQTTLVRL